jgi:hypothetical protein
VFLGKVAPHTVDAGCGRLGETFGEENRGVDSVHTLGHGLGRTGAGLARIPYVWAGVQCLQGLECSSSPTSGTVFPQVRGLWPSDRAQISFYGPFRSPFLVGGRFCGRVPHSFVGRHVCVRASFMVGSGRGYMTCEGFGGPVLGVKRRVDGPSRVSQRMSPSRVTAQPCIGPSTVSRGHWRRAVRAEPSRTPPSRISATTRPKRERSRS